MLALLWREKNSYSDEHLDQQLDTRKKTLDIALDLYLTKQNYYKYYSCNIIVWLFEEARSKQFYLLARGKLSSHINAIPFKHITNRKNFAVCVGSNSSAARYAIGRPTMVSSGCWLSSKVNSTVLGSCCPRIRRSGTNLTISFLSRRSISGRSAPTLVSSACNITE